MSFIFKMPDLGEGIIEGEIVQWFVKEGDTIEADAPLLEIQNDKMVQEVPSPRSGKITKLYFQDGEVANVGDDLVEFDGDGSSAAASAPAKEEAPAAAPAVSGNTFTFNLPDLGEGILEGEIVQWLVKEGDTIEEDGPLVEIQNDKMVQEVPSPVAGTISKILVGDGTVAHVGDALVEIATDGAVSAPQAAPAAQAAAPAQTAPQAQVDGKVYADNKIAGRILALPSVRQYARDKNVDLTQVVATGKRGHVTMADVDAFLAGGAPAVQETVAEQPETAAPKAPEASKPAAQPAQPIKTDGDTSRVAMTMTRKAIANAMVNSKAKAPHVTLFDEVEVSKLMDHRKKFKDIALEQDVRLTFLTYVTKAVTAVARKFPDLNASIDDTTQEIVYKNYYNIGIAVDTPHGLYVPNIKDADKKSMFAIADEIVTHATAANEGTLKGPDMRDGTITISNIGSARGQWFTPIINYPEVAIFGMGRIDKKPIVLEDGTLGIGNMMYLSLSFDHRIIDGMTAQLAMNELKRLLSEPEILLMEV